MASFIGTDEAGYGPKLGPLVVALSAWEVPSDHLGADLYRQMAPYIQRRAATARSRGVPIADSKQLYGPTHNLASLESVVLAILQLLGRPLRSWQQAWARCAPEFLQTAAEIPWYDGYDERLPVAATQETIEKTVRRLQRGCDKANVRPSDLRAAVICSESFNRLVAQAGSKGSVLSAVTLRLIGEVLDAPVPGGGRSPAAPFGPGPTTTGRGPLGPIRIICDKHAGRNHYAGLLQMTLNVPLVQVVREGQKESVYRATREGCPLQIAFQAGGEAHLPTALASMTAKYLRELAMRAFNRFWCSQIAQLRPTAGYAADSHRFRQQIGPALQRLGIAPERLWRGR